MAWGQRGDQSYVMTEPKGAVLMREWLRAFPGGYGNGSRGLSELYKSPPCIAVLLCEGGDGYWSDELEFDVLSI